MPRNLRGLFLSCGIEFAGTCKTTLMRKILLPLLALLFSLLFSRDSGAVTASPPSLPLTEEQKSAVRAAFEELRNMPRGERFKKLKQAKKEIRKFREARKAGREADTNTLLLVILALLLPPLAVYLHQGETNSKFWITLLLFLLGIAGAFFFSWLLIFASVVYALIVILGAA